MSEEEYCGKCGCRCFGNIFLCPGSSVPCPVCGCGVSYARMMQSSVREGGLARENNQQQYLTEKENDEMLQRSQGGNTASTSNRASQPTGLPWLKTEHMSSEKRTLTILKARAEQDRWNNQSVLMQVRYDGKLFLWQPNAKNPNFDTLIDLLGEDESKWAGNTVLAYLEEDDMTHKMYMRVEESDQPATAADNGGKGKKK